MMEPNTAAVDATQPEGAPAEPTLVVRQGFRVGNVHLLAAFEQASELMELPRLFTIPRAPAGMLGVVNVHGRILPVFDLATALGTSHLARVKRMLLVIGHGDDAAGVVVDGLPRRMAFAPEDQTFTAPPGDLPQEQLTSTWRQLNQTWYELDYTRLFDQLSTRTQLQ
jgi:twitching motility protein PilI